MNEINSILAPSFLPSTVVIELTYNCNHICLFCSCPWEKPNSQFQKYPELQTNDWKKVSVS